MKVERDLKGFSLPFAAGVTCSVYSKDIIGYQPINLASILYILCIVNLICISVFFHKRKLVSILPLLVYLEGIVCGMWVGTGGLILEISDTQSIVNDFATSSKLWLTELIDRIRFENKDTGPLIKALLAGDKSDLTNEIKNSFRNSGASHILALSGMHLGIIYSVIATFLRLAGQSRIAVITKSSLLIIICGIYTIITGASPSLTRAFIFILLREVARVAGRSMELKNILCSSIIIHLIISPISIQSAGFQLSYAAMIGIAYIFPTINKIWPHESGKYQDFHFLHKIWEISALSLSCQLTAGTVAWVYFGTFPKYFLITNLIAMPLSTIIIPLALFTLLANYMGINCAFLQIITEKTVKLLTDSLSTISTLSD